MKYVFIYTLFLMPVLHFSCGQKQTEPHEEKINYTFKDTATSCGPAGQVRNIKKGSNGTILITSTAAGVFRYDGKSFARLTGNIGPRRFWDVMEDRRGNLWFASIDSGVYKYNVKSLPGGQAGFQHFTTREGLADNRVMCIYEDKAGNIWFGTGGGVSRYDARLDDGVGQGKSLPAGQAGFRNFTTKDGLSHNDLTTIMEDKTGKLWFGTRREPCFYDGKTFTILKNKDGKAFHNVWSILEDKKGSIWLGDNDGLWRYDGGTITKVSQKGAYAIIEDKKGNIWSTGANEPPRIGQVWSLSRYDAKSLYSKKPTVTEIVSGPPAFLGLFEANDGSIWFGSVSGVYRYDGKTIKDFKSAAGQK